MPYAFQSLNRQSQMAAALIVLGILNTTKSVVGKCQGGTPILNLQIMPVLRFCILNVLSSFHYLREEFNLKFVPTQSILSISLPISIQVNSLARMIPKVNAMMNYVIYVTQRQIDPGSVRG